MKKGLIFDMDGTLWDSSVQVAKAWDLAVAQCGYERSSITKEEMQSVMGKTMDVIAEILFPGVTGEEREKLLRACCEVENDYLREHGGTLYPGIRSTLESLKEKYHLFIVSNCQSGYIEAFLDYYHMWELFEDIACFGDNGKQKGENIALLYERNHLKKAAYVGDIEGDYQATLQAAEIVDGELSFIHAAYGFGTISDEVLKIERFEDLKVVSDRFFLS